jgi:hypothetical protein
MSDALTGPSHRPESNIGGYGGLDVDPDLSRTPRPARPPVRRAERNAAAVKGQAPPAEGARPLRPRSRFQHPGLDQCDRHRYRRYVRDPGSVEPGRCNALLASPADDLALNPGWVARRVSTHP